MLPEIDININALITSLCEEYPKQQDKIRQIPILIEEIETQENKKEPIEKLQEINNTLYQDHPYNETIDLQIIINTYRNKYDLTDPREITHIDNGKGYVQ